MTDVEPNYYGNVANDSNTYSGSVQPDWHATVSDTHNFGPRTLLDMRAGYARNGFDRRPISAGFDPTQLGFPAALARSAQVLYFPTIQPQGYSGVGARSNDLFFLGADTFSLLPQTDVGPRAARHQNRRRLPDPAPQHVQRRQPRRHLLVLEGLYPGTRPAARRLTAETPTPPCCSAPCREGPFRSRLTRAGEQSIRRVTSRMI